MKPTEFKAREIDILIRIANELVLLSDEEELPRKVREILWAQSSHLKRVTRAHGSRPKVGGKKIKKGEVVDEWPIYRDEVREALK